MSDIYTISQNVRSKVDFELFMRKLQEDYATNQSIWENNQLEAYLEGLLGYISDATFDENKLGKTF